MTIAAGFCCNEGIVLCADTQETITGYIKRYDGKIVTHVYRHAMISTAGSGTSDYIHTARERAVLGLDEALTFSAIRDKLRSNLMGFFDEHMSRWSSFADGDRPTVELLIAVSVLSGGTALFHWSGTAFYQTANKAIGAGILLANTMMGEYFSGNLNLKELSSLAIFILSKVKKHVDTCGGSTHMVVLRHGADFALVDSREIEKLEKQAEQMELRSVAKLKKQISGKHLPDYIWLREMAVSKTHDVVAVKKAAP